ncbi:hypothetical protein Pint_30628 [Pistacia integerrima]|uniref:Uncharacterized protein n=1 Tax=Pistacia integerrima TaxID=434235 RepID=A0ACC0WWR9_9ROSI|nr:hypothetical protein Pint_30628 [Pistacia integerrima]
MGSRTPLRLPVIDFSKPNLKPGSPEWDSVKSQVRKALEEFGCFEALFDKVPVELRKSIFGALEALFDLPLQTKLRNLSKKPFHGYVGQYPQVPLYESMGIDDANIIEKVESMTNNLWPEGKESFSKTIVSFSEQVSELDQTIRRMILESFNLEKDRDEHMNSTNYLLRVTILYQNQVDGLEVQTKNGEWIQLKPSPDSFIAMIGDSLYAWTNGRLYSPYHRVMMTGNEARYSAGLFSIPKAAGQRAQSALKTYCGV